MNKSEMFWHITCRSKIRGRGVMLQYSRVMHVQIIMYSHKYAYSYLTCAFLVHWHAFTICDIVFLWNGREILVIRCAVTKDVNRHLRVQKLKSNPSNVVFVLPSERHFGSFDACLCYYCHHAIDLLFRQIIKGSKGYKRKHQLWLHKWNSNLNSTDIFLDLFVVFSFWFIFQCFFLFCLCDTRNKSWLEDHIWHFNKSLSTSETWFSNQRKKTTKRDTDLVFQDSENCLVTGCIWP